MAHLRRAPMKETLSGADSGFLERGSYTRGVWKVRIMAS